MTVAAEFAKVNQVIEYLLCIEGISWPTNDLGGDLSGGFDGDVFVTADLNGDLASVLGCTIHDGLMLPGSISEKIDPRDGKYTPSGLSVEIVDTDDWWLSNYTPRATGTADALAASIDYKDVNIDLTSGNHAGGATIWMGGRELIVLGTKSGAGPYTYTGCTRGYLGTHRGSVLRRPEDNIHGKWITGTSTNSVARFWHNRRAALYAHVPGETVGSCMLLWVGKLKGLTNKGGVGVEYSLEFTGDFMGELGRTYKQQAWTVTGYADTNIPPEYVDVSLYGTGSMQIEVSPGVLSGYFSVRFGAAQPSGNTNENDGAYNMAAAYQYRSEAGGTDGMVSGWDSGTVQALDDATAGNNILMTFAKVGERIMLLAKQDDRGTLQKDLVLVHKWSAVGSNITASDFYGARGVFLLSNWFDSKLFNRFQVNGVVTRHPIDILLCFLCSMDRELFRADVIAGSTTTVAEFTLGTVGAVNLWAGKALFSVEQANTKWEARTITSNTVNDITVEKAFSNAPASGNEYQVRNSIYDVLPIGWGMGIDTNKIDISSFEEIREKYLPGEEVGRFMLGSDDSIDLMKLLTENILKPYGILLRQGRSSGKIEAVYLGQALGDGLVDTYTAITTSHISNPGDIKHSFHPPIGVIDVELRRTEDHVVGFESHGRNSQAAFEAIETMIEGGDKTKLSIRSTEIESAFQEGERDKLTFRALFDTPSTAGPLLARMYGLVALYSIPPPVWECDLDIVLYPTCQVGDWVSITYNDPAAPVNSFTGARGFTSVYGRIVSVALQLSERPVFRAAIELFFDSINSAKVAPAATVTAKGNDANGDYFVVNTGDYTNDSTLKDSFYFRTGDLITIRDITGAAKEAETIKGFGTTFTTGVPSGTDGTRIYVNGTIARVIVAGDYVTFTNYSGSNTARMDLYCAYSATSSGLTGGDNAKEYA